MQTSRLRTALVASVILSAGLLLSCAVGTSSRVDGRRRDSTSSPTDSALVDGPDLQHDIAVERRASGEATVPADARPRDVVSADTKPPPDLCPVCGSGMACAQGKCVCDPKTCTGCCSADGSSCKPGKDNTACGSGGVVCAPCATTDSCKTASCSTGACLITNNPVAPYPCPGAFGTLCGGSTGVVCQTGFICASFSAGATGFCSKYCFVSGSLCTGAPAGLSASCNLTGSSGQYLCGFTCFPGLCPKGLSCDVFDGVCKL